MKQFILLAALALSSSHLFAGGAELYTKYGCNNCHGTYSTSGQLNGNVLVPGARNFNVKVDFIKGTTEQDIFNTITKGVSVAEGGSGMMNAWGAIISEADRKEIAKYIVSLMK